MRYLVIHSDMWDEETVVEDFSSITQAEEYIAAKIDDEGLEPGRFRVYQARQLELKTKTVAELERL